MGSDQTFMFWRKALVLGAVVGLAGFRADAFVPAARLADRGMGQVRGFRQQVHESVYQPTQAKSRRRETVKCILDFRSLSQVASNEEELAYDTSSGKTVTFQGSRSAEREVMEGPRPIKDYMALPPSQYSVLDADAVTRIGEDSFRCVINGINFLGYKLVPILYVKVLVDAVAGKSFLEVYKIELTGSRIAEVANGTFQVRARNVVGYRPVPERPGHAFLQSTVSVEVEALVPKSNVIPLRVLRKGGSLVIQGVLNVMVPQFVKVLSKDYRTWSAGDDTRAAVADVKLTAPEEEL